MSWTFSDLAPFHQQAPLVPHTTWPRDELQSIKSSKRRRTLDDTWTTVGDQGTGFISGQVVGLDLNSIKAAKLIYLKDGTHIGACVLKTCTLAIVVGEHVFVQAHELRPMEAYSQVNQMICTFSKIAVASIVEKLPDAPKMALQTHKWEMGSPRLASLTQAGGCLNSIQRIKLTITKVTTVTGDYVSANVMRLGTVFVISGAMISRYAEIFHVYLRPHTIMEVIHDDEDSQVPDYMSAGGATDDCSLNIRDSVMQLDQLPVDCEQFTTITGYITGMGTGTKRLIAAIWYWNRIVTYLLIGKVPHVVEGSW